MLRATIALSSCVTIGLACLGLISPQAVAAIGAACFCLASGRVLIRSE